MKKSSGFSLVELLVVVAVLALLSWIAIPRILQIRNERNKEPAVRQVPTPEQIENELALKRQSEIEARLLLIKDFKNGIYYFPFVNDEYRVMLSTFLDRHTNLEVVDTDSDVVRQTRFGSNDPNSDFGATIGHTVILREKR